MHQVTHYMKNKYKFLSHLSIGSVFFFVEVDIKSLVSPYTYKRFYKILADRAKVRHVIRKEEEHYDNYVESM